MVARLQSLSPALTSTTSTQQTQQTQQTQPKTWLSPGVLNLDPTLTAHPSPALQAARQQLGSSFQTFISDPDRLKAALDGAKAFGGDNLKTQQLADWMFRNAQLQQLLHAVR